MLLADHLPAINRFPEKPLLYNVTWKTAIYFCLATLIHYLERLFDLAKEAGGIVAGNAKLVSEIVWPHFLAIQIVLLVLVFNYRVIRELGRIMGEESLWRVFFVTPQRQKSQRETTGQ